MSTVFLAWQDNREASRGWYPIGKLESESIDGPFRFEYVKGAERAHKESQMSPLLSFPDFRKIYEAPTLFPLFSNRLVQSNRGDLKEYLKLLEIDSSKADPLEILAITEGRRQTDAFEVFPKIERKPDGTFNCRFFLHGWRYVNEHGRNRLESLKPGDELRISIELCNSATNLAYLLLTSDYLPVGWAPRYLIMDLLKSSNEFHNHLKARVVGVNSSFLAGNNQKVLVELSGLYPDDVEPMSSSDFEPLGTH